MLFVVCVPISLKKVCCKLRTVTLNLMLFEFIHVNIEHKWQF
jgi:hypothetical protein